MEKAKSMKTTPALSWTNSKLELRETKKCGHGIFAKADIYNGETIHVFEGKIFTLQGILDQINSGAENIDDPLQVDDESFMDLDDASRAFNHGCNPNSGLRGNGVLFAIRDIEEGEEVTYDYSLTVGTNITSDMWAMECRCGAENCREIIGNVLSVSENTLRDHEDAGAFLDFIKKQLLLV